MDPARIHGAGDERLRSLPVAAVSRREDSHVGRASARDAAGHDGRGPGRAEALCAQVAALLAFGVRPGVPPVRVSGLVSADVGMLPAARPVSTAARCVICDLLLHGAGGVQHLLTFSRGAVC
ncbi:protein of unknown function [Paraburkholderia kururiensis]